MAVNTKLNILSVALISLIVTCCQNETKDDGIVVSAFDAQIIDKLGAMVSKSAQIWPGYVLAKSPKTYLIIQDANATGAHGYLFNAPTTFLKNAKKVSNGQAHGLNLYQDQNYLNSAEAFLGNYSFYSLADFKIEGQNVLLARTAIESSPAYSWYIQFKNFENNLLPLVTTHEAFHIFQFDNWKFPSDSLTVGDYPLTKEIIAHELHIFSSMINAYQVSNQVDALKLLKEYVVMFSKLQSLDLSAEQRLSRMARFTQFQEGSARYVEHFSALQTIYPTINSDPTHGWKKVLDSTKDGLEVKGILSFRIWYHVGAGIIRLLKLSGVSVETKLSEGVTPHDLAEAFVNLSAQERETIYQSIVSGNAVWNDEVVRAAYLFSLL